MRGDNLWRGIGVAAVFAVIGPLIGATLVLLVLAVAILTTNPENGAFALLMWPFAAALGMMIGFVPALATGVTMGLVSARLDGRWRWIGAAAVCGIVVTAVFHRLAGLDQDALIAVGCGGGAATVCALITMHWRPRRT